MDKIGSFTRLRQIVLEAHDRIVGMVLEEIIADRAHRQGTGQCSPKLGKQDMKRSSMTDGYWPSNRNHLPIRAL